MNRPWMPLYIADYLADTAHLNAAHSGAYLHLIMHYWQTGGLPDDDAALTRIARMTTAEWRKARPIIAHFFQDGWRHKRIDAELAHAAEVSSKRRASAEQRYSKSNANAPPNAEQLDTHARGLSQPQSHPQDPSLRSGNARTKNPPAGFEQFWQAFPNKVGKREAEKAFEKAIKSGVDIERISAGLNAYRNKNDDRPWCNPATWLNQGRWDDQPAAAVNGHGRDQKSLLGAIERFEKKFGDDRGEDDLLSLPPR